MSILFSDIFEAIRTIRATKGTSEKDILNYVQERVGGRLSVNNSCRKLSPKEMFNYKYPLLEVIQAIEQLQENKGKTNVQVCNFVRKRAKNPNDPMKVLKTVCTLNKLVDEGILIKKGKRYSLPKPLRKREEHESLREGIKETLNDANDEAKKLYDDQGRRGEERRAGRGDEMSDDDQGPDEDEEDEDDEDEDDDDDDDDNTSHNSNDCEENVEERRGKNMRELEEGEVSSNPKTNSNIRDNRCLNNTEIKGDHCKGCLKSRNVRGESKCRKAPEKKAVTGRRRKRVIGGTMNSCKIPEVGEVIFSARDFSDEQDDTTQEEFSKMGEAMELVPEVNEKSKEISSIFQAKHRKSRSRRSPASNSRYRSRSPIKVPSTEKYQQRLAKDQSDENGAPEKVSDIRQKTHPEFLERDPERADDGVKGGHNNCHRSDSANFITPKNSFVYVKREKSSNSNQGKEEHKMEQKQEPGTDVMNQCGLRRRGEASATKLKVKGKLKVDGSDAKKRKKGLAHIKCEKDDGHGVLCSLCDKKKAKK